MSEREPDRIILDIDVGNTRLKWRVVDSRGCAIEAGSAESDKDFLTELKGRYPLIDGVRLACVAKKVVAAELCEAVHRLWGVQVMLAETQKQFAGVTVAYADPERLGVDRWLAMLAAYHKECGAVCVIDCGSAITVDLVDKGGRQVGGYIVPGIAMQVDSLLAGTGQIRLENAILPDIQRWGASTEEAVNFGVLRQVVSFIDNVLDGLVDESVTVYLTGGDASLVASKIKVGCRCLLWSDLVMDGLAIAFPANNDVRLG